MKCEEMKTGLCRRSVTLGIRRRTKSEWEEVGAPVPTMKGSHCVQENELFTVFDRSL